MTVKERIAWGLLAGVAIVLVKILGPDQNFVHSFFVSNPDTHGYINLPQILAYSVISLVTISLGGIAGAFTKEDDKTRILLFAISFLALLTTVTAQERAPIRKDIAQINYPQTQPTTTSRLDFSWFISSAKAQTTTAETCVEASFTSKVFQSTYDYLAGSKPDQGAIYHLVIASEKNLQAAKIFADQTASKTEYKITIGCKRPKNPYFPIYIGEPMNRTDILEFKGLITAQNLTTPPDVPYVSAYEYRTTIYTPKN